MTKNQWFWGVFALWELLLLPIIGQRLVLTLEKKNLLLLLIMDSITFRPFVFSRFINDYINAHFL